ncbi:MAG: hypothetical protein JWP08_2242, partial [Bryobacterales bacterium]|nr:hypothetical protein [Bryobacterales bacterium]
LLLADSGKFTFTVPAFAARTGPVALGLVLCTVFLRFLLLPRYPIPVPSGADDFGYWLLADTLRHFRLANSPHAFPEFFEQIFVLQRPTYSSMFNLGQGIALALGWILFGHPWAGVLLSGALLSAGCCWALRGWTSPGWALAGGVFAMMQFGPLSYWTNSYWGGAVSACAGCLVFGSLPRWNTHRHGMYALLLGLGLALELITRPFEFLFLLTAVALALPWLDNRARLVLIATPVIGIAACLMALQNKAVTGAWTTTPYVLYRHQYGVPATFTFQQNPVPHRPLNQEQQLDYEAESAIHGTAPETLGAYARRFFFRLRFGRFFLLPPLYFAVFAFLLQIRTYRQLSIALSVAVFAAGSNFYPYFYPHYIAAIAPLFLLMSVEGLRNMNAWRPAAGTSLFLLCCVQFLFWYLVRLSSHDALTEFESWDFINWGDPQGRIQIAHTLERTPGKLLVFVHYAPGHAFSEWIHNAADIDSSRIIWAHDLGDTENRRLRQHYADRAVLLCEPDATPPVVRMYPIQNGPFEEVR